MMLKNILQNNIIIGMLLFFQDLNEGTTLTAINGQERPALEIFSHALHYFKEHALQQMKDQSSTNILNEDVRWVITVPAIWKAEAKQFMRRAAYDVSELKLKILYFNSEYLFYTRKHVTIWYRSHMTCDECFSHGIDQRLFLDEIQFGDPPSHLYTYQSFAWIWIHTTCIAQINLYLIVSRDRKNGYEFIIEILLKKKNYVNYDSIESVRSQCRTC